MGALPDGVRADTVEMPGTGAQSRRAEKVPLQEQADEPGWEHHRPVGEHVRLAREGEKPVLFRRVEIWDQEKEEAIVFLSNLLAFGATTIAAIYKDRWEVELFFKADRKST